MIEDKAIVYFALSFYVLRYDLFDVRKTIQIFLKFIQSYTLRIIIAAQSTLQEVLLTNH